jgi:hypothetical protein
MGGTSKLCGCVQSRLVALAIGLVWLAGCGEKLTADAYDDITPGMTRQEIEQKLGPGEIRGVERDRRERAKAQPAGAAVEASAAGVPAGADASAASAASAEGAEGEQSGNASLTVVAVNDVASKGAAAASLAGGVGNAVAPAKGNASGPASKAQASPSVAKPKWKITPPTPKAQRSMGQRMTVVWRDGLKRIEVTFVDDKAVSKLASGLE